MKDYHEPWDQLPSEIRDHTRALTSLKEEIEAVDWYAQRVAACENEELRQVLQHNRDEEIEHACMTLEWLRRHVPEWDEHLRTFLFTDGPIVDVEKGETSAPGAPAARASTTPEASSRRATGDLALGSLKGELK